MSIWEQIDQKLSEYEQPDFAADDIEDALLKVTDILIKCKPNETFDVIWIPDIDPVPTYSTYTKTNNSLEWQDCDKEPVALRKMLMTIHKNMYDIEGMTLNGKLIWGKDRR